MENQISRPDHKLITVMRHAPTGLAEIDKTGKITFLNAKGESLLKPIRIANNINGNNFYPLLETIAPVIVKKIKDSSDDAGNILTDELHCFSISFGEERVERYFNFTVIKISPHSIIIGFDDITDNHLKEKAITELIADKAAAQGKYEIASNVLHDIGNAVVGFSSHINRIRRILEHNNSDNLQKLSEFFTTRRPALAQVFGELKAEAIMNMLAGITGSQQKDQEEIGRSTKEQLNIVNHVQEILNIQRQYLTGHTALEKKPTDLRSLINDCMAMSYASIEKRSITISLDIPRNLPLINADRTRLMQVLLNVLKNSIEAIDINSDAKRISVIVRAKKNLIVVQVHDSGHGFDQATGNQLFVRGFTTKASGTGLGLANCKSIIESHEGTINISSDGFGKGATTTIEFKT